MFIRYWFWKINMIGIDLPDHCALGIFAFLSVDDSTTPCWMLNLINSLSGICRKVDVFFISELQIFISRHENNHKSAVIIPTYLLEKTPLFGPKNTSDRGNIMLLMLNCQLLTQHCETYNIDDGHENCDNIYVADYFGKCLTICNKQTKTSRITAYYHNSAQW